MMRCLLLSLFAACGSSSPNQPPAVEPHAPNAPHAPAAAHAPHAHGEPHSHAGHRGGMHHRFDNAEQWAKVFDDPQRDAWQKPDEVIASLSLTPAMIVADIGAGTGYFAVRLARAVPQGRVIATDLEADMVRYMTERAQKEKLTNLAAKVTPADDPQLAPSSIDRILVVDVWHHLGDRVAYAKKLASSLKAGGQLHVVDFKLDATRGPPKQHRLAPEAIVADLKAAGLDASIAPLALPDQYIVVGRLGRN